MLHFMGPDELIARKCFDSTFANVPKTLSRETTNKTQPLSLHELIYFCWLICYLYFNRWMLSAVTVIWPRAICP